MIYEIDYNKKNYENHLIFCGLLALFFIFINFKGLINFKFSSNTSFWLVIFVVTIESCAWLILVYMLFKDFLTTDCAKTYGILAKNRPYETCSLEIRDEYFLISSENIKKKFYFKDIKIKNNFRSIVIRLSDYTTIKFSYKNNNEELFSALISAQNKANNLN